MDTGPQSKQIVFLSGDVRANENPALQSLHTLFFREHNRRARILADKNPLWDDERIYQEARKMVMGFIQKITYDQYVPAVTGSRLPTWKKYDEQVNPGIDAFFGACSFRYGHSAVPGLLRRLQEDGSESLDGPLLLRDHFFNTRAVKSSGIEPILRGMLLAREQKVDTLMTNELRRHFANQPFDLAAWNIQRGRDVGLPTYNEMRSLFMLPQVTTFSEITSSPAVQIALQELYGDVNNIDAYVGGLAEDHLSSARVGPLFAASIMDQFTRLRDGDRFYYKNYNQTGLWTKAEVDEIDSITLGKLITLNTDIENYPDNAFQIPTSLNGVFNGKTSTCSASNGAGAGAGDTASNRIALGDQLLLQWNTTDTNVIFTFSSKAVGWFGFGLGGSGMVNVDLKIAYLDSASKKLTVGDYWSDNFNAVTDTSVGGTTDISDIADVSGTVDGYVRSVQFRVPLAPSDKKDVAIKTGSQPITYAWSKDSDTPGYHGPNKGSTTVNFFASTSNSSSDGAQNPVAALPEHWPASLQILHGVIMIVSFGLLYPWGIFIARYGQVGKWVLMHERIMTISSSDVILAALAAFAGAGSSAMSQTHAKLGATVFATVLFTIGWFIKSNHSTKPAAYIRISHWLSGYVSFILGISNCFLGIDVLSNIVPAARNTTWVLIAWLIFVLIVFIVFGELRKRTLMRKQEERLARVPEIVSDEDEKDDMAQTKPMPTFTWEEINNRVAGGALYLVIDKIVYDVAPYLHKHPGGSRMIIDSIGMDATREFHGKGPFTRMGSMRSNSTSDIEASRQITFSLPKTSGTLHKHSRFAHFELSKLAIGIVRKEPQWNPFDDFPNISKVIAMEYGIDRNNALDANQPRRLKVVDKKILVPKDAKFAVYLFRFAFENESDVYMALPGDAIAIAANVEGRLVSRFYTPIEVRNHGHLDFIIKIYPNGTLTNHLNSLRLGDQVRIRGPIRNQRVIHPSTPNGCFPYVGMIAAGTGITPMLLLIDFYRKYSVDNRIEGPRPQMVLLTLDSSDKDLVYETQLEELQQKYPSLLTIHRMVKIAHHGGWTGFTGPITPTILEDIMPLPTTYVPSSIKSNQKGKKPVGSTEYDLKTPTTAVTSSPTANAYDSAGEFSSRGMMDDDRTFADPTDILMVVCGPPSFDDTVRGMLLGLGYFPHNIVTL
ncbi:hypothetical protein HK102_013291 [Quaeritorhiza haematococci]|nr:hypothetical protein HK102_013291 [Quaeritorhiza haematococci]